MSIWGQRVSVWGFLRSCLCCKSEDGCFLGFLSQSRALCAAVWVRLGWFYTRVKNLTQKRSSDSILPVSPAQFQLQPSPRPHCCAQVGSRGLCLRLPLGSVELLCWCCTQLAAFVAPFQLGKFLVTFSLCRVPRTAGLAGHTSLHTCSIQTVLGLHVLTAGLWAWAPSKEFKTEWDFLASGIGGLGSTKPGCAASLQLFALLHSTNLSAFILFLALSVSLLHCCAELQWSCGAAELCELWLQWELCAGQVLLRFLKPSAAECLDELCTAFLFCFFFWVILQYLCFSSYKVPRCRMAVQKDLCWLLKSISKWQGAATGLCYQPLPMKLHCCRDPY